LREKTKTPFQTLKQLKGHGVGIFHNKFIDKERLSETRYEEKTWQKRFEQEKLPFG
jgi:hypothetical protein